MTVDYGRANLAIACVFVDELARRGVAQAVICPGSRSTPVAVALASHPALRTRALIDERSAAFFALGMARQLAQPVALLSTSGTAAANFLPAIAEASLSRIPFLVLTADRPPEHRDWGAAQTIDQIRLYGDHVKWFVDMPVPCEEPALIRHARSSAARAVQTAADSPSGPVHLNLPFREPLLPSELQASDALDTFFSIGRAPAHATTAPPSRHLACESILSEVADIFASERKGVIVCGPSEAPGHTAEIAALSQAVGYPILADPLSGLRFGPHDRSAIVDAYDSFLRHADAAARLAPDVVIRIGAVPTSKPLQQFLLANPGRAHVVIDPGTPRDPSHLATHHVRADAAATCAVLATNVDKRDVVVRNYWIENWLAADRTANAAIRAALAHGEELFEGRALAEVAALLPEGSTLVVGNSMPVRDADAFVRGDRRSLRVVGNRGANGIDGVNSSALGAAAVSTEPVVLVVGDLSFFHDLGGLFAARKPGVDATIVVLNNDGGGIFSFLPQVEQLDTATFEALFGTPTGLDVGAAAALFEASYARPADWRSFRRDVCRAINEPGLSIVEVVTDRTRNVAQHRAVWDAVAVALRSTQFNGA